MKTETTQTTSLVRTAAAMSAVTLLAFFLRLHAIDAESIWLDEAYTYARAKLPVSDVIAASIKKHHNPSYFLFMHYWIALGDDELWLRLPSAIFGALTAGAACLLGALACSLRVGVIAGALFACAPVQVYFGQEARMYTLLTFVTSVAMCSLTWLARNIEDATASPLGGRSLGEASPDRTSMSRTARVAYVTYALGTLGALYLHNTGVFFGAAMAVAGLVVMVSARERRWQFARNFGLANAGVLAIFALYVGSLLRQTKEVANNFWDKFPTLDAFATIAQSLYLMSAPLLSPAGVMLVVALGLGAWTLRTRPALLGLLLAGTIVAPLLLLLVSLHTPMFGTRLLLWTAVPCFVVMSVGIARLPGTWSPLVFVSVVVALVSPTLQREYATTTKEPWRPVLEAIAAEQAKKPLIIVPSTQEETVVDYYFHRRTRPLPEMPVKLVRGKNIERRMRALRHVSDVWLIDRKRGARTAEALAALRDRGEVRGELWGEYVQVDHVKLRAGAPSKAQGSSPR